MYKYSPAGDLTVVSVCIVMIILICFSFVRKSRSFKLFLGILAAVILGAFSDVTFHQLASASQFSAALGVRCLFHALLGFVFVLFGLYICEVTHLNRRQRSVFTAILWTLFAVIVVLDIMKAVSLTTSGVTDLEVLTEGRNIFALGYVAFSVLMVLMIIYVRKRIFVQILMGFIGSIVLSFVMILVQMLLHQSSYTVASFLYPVIAMFYSMHANPYNAQLGAVDRTAFEDFVRENYETGREFVYLSLYMRHFAEDNAKLTDALQTCIRQHASTSFKHALLFRVEKGHMILAAVKDRNFDWQERLAAVLTEFQKEYDRFQYEYKLIVGESMDEISRNNEYVSFLRDIRGGMEENTIHFTEDEDVLRFNRSEYIRKSLEDIYQKHDLNDPRVLTYCQPVFNIKTGKYDTAEALMRLELNGEIVSPNQFIPVAEENGYIHMLTEIILYKTCLEIRRLLEEGFALSRISVNVSALELKDDAFCEDVSRIIHESRIPGGKIAIELTESQTDDDFLLMKKKISELRKQGIKFYLDDFGTGYSNMERIMELPFDIIKFDRSLVLASENSEKSKKIVVGLANIFTSMNYAVLYEGVERDDEVQMCKAMSASYLQGFRFAKPVPISELKNYFENQKGSVV